LNWQKFTKLTDARGCPIRIGKASEGLEARYRGGTGYAMDAAMRHSDQPVSSLRLFSRADLSNVNFKSQFPPCRCAILPTALRLIGGACCVTGDLGSEKCVCWKTNHRQSAYFCDLCCDVFRLSLAFRLQHCRNQSISEMGCSSFC